MPQIQCVTNVMSYAILSASGTWTLQGGFPTHVDEIIIRQLAYNSADAVKNIYLIGSSINNQMLGAVANLGGFSACPGTVIRLTSPLPNVITFQLYFPGAPAFPAAVTAGDMVSISMDFISYKR